MFYGVTAKRRGGPFLLKGDVFIFPFHGQRDHGAGWEVAVCGASEEGQGGGVGWGEGERWELGGETGEGRKGREGESREGRKQTPMC